MEPGIYHFAQSVKIWWRLDVLLAAILKKSRVQSGIIPAYSSGQDESEPIPEDQQNKYFGRNYYCIHFVNDMVDHNFHGICTMPLPNNTAKLKII